MRTPILVLIALFTFEAPIHAQQISSGEFGIAFGNFVNYYNSHGHTFPPKVFTLLNRSATLKAFLKTLDKSYVALPQSDTVDTVHYIADPMAYYPIDTVFMELQRNFFAKGVFTGGKYMGKRLKGKRVILFSPESLRSSFIPYGSLDNIEHERYADVITFARFASTGDQRIGEWIERIAHEITHCYRFISGLSSSGSTVLKRIASAIEDEVKTRKGEKTIVGEATKDSVLPTFTATLQSTDPADVQRDFFPAKLMRTYLEAFVWNELARSAIRSDSLSERDIDDLNSWADSLSLDKWYMYSTGSTIILPSGLHEPITSRYLELRLIQRLIDQDWRTFEQDAPDDSIEYEKEKEIILQAHAAKFFQRVTTYLPLH